MLTTNQVKATIDTRGGELVRLELLHFIDHVDKARNVVLFDRTRERLYLARSGLATVDGVAYPNHETVMRSRFPLFRARQVPATSPPYSTTPGLPARSQMARRCACSGTM